MPAGGELVQQDAEREDVRLGRDRLAARLLGRHVADRADDEARLRCSAGRVAGRERVGLQPGQPEVEQLDVAVGPDHHVLGLDVAVHDLRGVGDGERLGDLPRDGERRATPAALARRASRSVTPSTSSIAM